MSNKDRTVAYFSMEIGVDPEIRTYSGGLGVLAGDTARSAADLGVPMVVVSILHRKGYFRQELDDSGNQFERPYEWSVEDYLTDAGVQISLTIEGRTVHVRAWKYEVKGVGGDSVPVYFLDTDIEDNSDKDRALSHYLYGGDSEYRLCQEVVLGMGGIRILRALGYYDIRKYHMNEGHASLLTLELLNERLVREERRTPTTEDIDAIRKLCVFTTHTPVEAGHDRFPQDQVERILGKNEAFDMKDGFCQEGVCNMTYLGFNLSSFINGVARKHGEVSREMFDRYYIDSITNGVHAATWVSKPMAKLFDKYISGWQGDNFSLRYAMSIPHHEVWEAHCEAKNEFFDYVCNKTGVSLCGDVLTLGFARRVATYKRADLLFWDIKRLKHIANTAGKFQIVFAGKAHPHDEPGKELIRRVFEAKKALEGVVPVVYLEDYDMTVGALVTSGVDIWLNTPQPPLEASGTSGMKAALNGIPSLSVLDGWWIEGCIEGITGWSICANGGGTVPVSDKAAEAVALYDKLEQVVLPTFYRERVRFLGIMRYAIALNGAFFNTERMMKEYVYKAYFG